MKFKLNTYSIVLIFNLMLLLTLILVIALGAYRYISFVKNNKPEPILVDLSQKKENEIIKNNDIDNSQSQTSNVENKDKSSVILIIQDVGLSETTTQEALKLPAEVIIGISAYSSDIEEVIRQAVGYNHEVFMNIPMEPLNYPIDDPGPYALLSQLSDQDNLSRLKFLLDRSPLITGVYTNKDEVFTKNIDNFKKFVQVLKKNKLNYISSSGQANISLEQIAQAKDYNLFLADLIIDEEINIDKIKVNLEKLEKLAINNKIATAVARPYPVTIEALKIWLADIDKKGIKLINTKSVSN